MSQLPQNFGNDNMKESINKPYSLQLPSNFGFNTNTNTNVNTKQIPIPSENVQYGVYCSSTFNHTS